MMMSSNSQDPKSFHDYSQSLQQVRQSERKRGRLFLVTSSLLFFVLGVVLTSQLYRTFMPSAQGEALDKLMTVYNLIKEEWYFGEEGTEDEFLERALTAMVNDQSEDAYLRYTAAPEPDTGEPTPPQYGIGVEVVSYDGYLRIQKVYASSPAANANLQVDDLIIRVDGVDIRYRSVSEVAALIQGDYETSVTIDLQRGEETITRTILRGTYRADTVFARPYVDDGYGLLTITGFQDDTLTHVNAALELFETAGLDRLIIDLRDNPGGFVMVFTQIADLFLPKDTVYGRYVYREDSKSYDVKAETNLRYSFERIVMLVNENSASASESLTAAMCDNLDQCLVVGTTTYGKGIAQKTISFTDGSSLKYTYAEFVRKDGTRLHEMGITPDFSIPVEGPHLIFSRTDVEDDSYERQVQDFLLALSFEGTTLESILLDLQSETGLPLSGELDQATLAKIQALSYDQERTAKHHQLEQAVLVLLQEEVEE